MIYGLYLHFYNQGELHEVRSMSDAGIETYCIGLSGLRLPGLPVNHISWLR